MLEFSTTPLQSVYMSGLKCEEELVPYEGRLLAIRVYEWVEIQVKRAAIWIGSSLAIRVCEWVES